jgi:hypothetical protein
MIGSDSASLDSVSTRHPVSLALSAVEPLSAVFRDMMTAVLPVWGHIIFTDELWFGTVTFGPSVSVASMDQYSGVLAEFSPAYGQPLADVGGAEGIVAHYRWMRVVVPLALKEAARRFVDDAFAWQAERETVATAFP